jgi:hypothetical protein
MKIDQSARLKIASQRKIIVEGSLGVQLPIRKAQEQSCECPVRPSASGAAGRSAAPAQHCRV